MFVTFVDPLALPCYDISYSSHVQNCSRTLSSSPVGHPHPSTFEKGDIFACFQPQPDEGPSDPPTF
jgi:hypothetical protein